MALTGEIDEQLREIDLPQEHPERGHDDIVDEGRDDLAEGAAHDEGDGHVDQVALHRKFFEFLEHVAPPSINKGYFYHNPSYFIVQPNIFYKSFFNSCIILLIV